MRQPRWAEMLGPPMSGALLHPLRDSDPHPAGPRGISAPVRRVRLRVQDRAGVPEALQEQPRRDGNRSGGGRPGQASADAPSVSSYAAAAASQSPAPPGPGR